MVKSQKQTLNYKRRRRIALAKSQRSTKAWRKQKSRPQSEQKASEKGER